MEFIDVNLQQRTIFPRRPLVSQFISYFAWVYKFRAVSSLTAFFTKGNALESHFS